jgi:hypothetical protein
LPSWLSPPQPGPPQLHILPFQRQVEPFAFGDIARGKNAIVGHHGRTAVPRTGREFVIGELLLAQHQLDAGIGPDNADLLLLTRGSRRSAG